MFDMRWIRESAEVLKDGLRARGWEGLRVEETVANLFALDDRRRETIAAAQKGQEERNRLSKEIGQAMGRKDAAAAAQLKERVAELRLELTLSEAAEKAAASELESAMLEVPNLPMDDVPPGVDERDNVEQRTVGAPPAFPEGQRPKEHFEIGESSGLMDFAAAARLSGARFVVLKGALAKLERALGQFMLDLHTTEHGYTEINPPLLVRDAAMYGTAQLPKFRDDQFAAGDGFWLIPTAEVPLTNLAREQILEEGALPMRLAALTPCFRAEAGAAGRDTRGIIRQHQFSKVELVSIVRPESALEEHERMTACAEEVLKRLGLHYRVVALCAGDMGFASRKTYDIEVWLPGQDKFREISSCSLCGDFQARRMNARFRPVGAKTTVFPFTLNGSGVAVGRALVAVLENYQNPDGSVTVPEALKPYMGGQSRLDFEIKA